MLNNVLLISEINKTNIYDVFEQMSNAITIAKVNHNLVS